MKITKYITNTALSALFLFGSTGCGGSDGDFLEETSYNLDSQTFYNTPNDIQLSLNYVYRYINYLLMGVQHNECSWLLMGVGLDTFTQTGSSALTSDWPIKMTASDGFVDHWFRYQYYFIYQLNVAIQAIEQRDIQWTTSTQKDEYKAEAMFLRGWFYRNLAGQFGGVPIVTEPSEELVVDFPRKTRTEVWQQCKSDFTFAAANLPLTTTQPGRAVRAVADHYLAEVNNTLGDFDGAIAAATRVIDGTDGDYHIMTTRFGTRKDETTDRYGHELNSYWDLFQIGNQNYNDGTSENYEALWVSQFNYGTYSTGGGGNAWWRCRYNQSESAMNSNIRSVNRSRTIDGTSINIYGTGATTNPDGTLSTSTRPDSLGTIGVYGPTNRPTNFYLYGLWAGSKSGDKEDFRGSETMIQRNTYQAGGKPWPQAIAEADALYGLTAADTVGLWPRLWKFSTDKRGTSTAGSSWQQYNCDWYIARLAETYLLRAEAYLAKGNTSAAAADINVLRDRANAPQCSASDVTIDYILDERARELFGEEHRWVTLSRLSNNPNLSSLNYGNVFYRRTKAYGWDYPNATDGKVRPNLSEYNYVMPLPSGFISTNTGSVIEQNLGYGDGSYDNSK